MSNGIGTNQDLLYVEINDGEAIELTIFPNFSTKIYYFHNFNEKLLKRFDFAPFTAFNIINNEYLAICSESQCLLINISNIGETMLILSMLSSTLVACTNRDKECCNNSVLCRESGKPISIMVAYLKSLMKDPKIDSFTIFKFIDTCSVCMMAYFIERNYYHSSVFKDSTFFHFSDELFRKYEPSEFLTLKTLGSGFNGHVSLVYHKKSSYFFAYKGINKIKMFLREKKFYQQYRHHCLVSSYGYVTTTSGDLGILMAFMSNGSVADLISNNLLDNTLRTKILNRVICAIDFLHSRGIMHRDIKPMNVLIDHNMDAFLSDFDSAREYVSRTKLTCDIGTVSYMSPEEASSNDYTFSTDLYSLGIFIYELTTGQNPYKDLSLSEALGKIKSGDVPELETGGEITYIYDYLTRLNPNDRYPSFYLLMSFKKRDLVYPDVDFIEMSEFIQNLRDQQNSINEDRCDFKHLVERAENGDVGSQFILANMYEDGTIVGQDYERALQWHLRAAEQGYAKSMNHIGVFYDLGYIEHDIEKALEWYMKAAELGDGDSMERIGLIYDDGELGEKDVEKAMEWYQKAAESGESDALVDLGLTYENSGEYDKALEFYFRAAEANNHMAINNIAHIYLKKKDYEKAFEWYQKGAKYGNPLSLFGLGHMYKKGFIEQDEKKAFDYFLKAAVNGNTDNLYEVAQYFLEGEVCEKDVGQAIYWHERAVENRDPDSAIALAHLYEIGDDIEQDFEKAVQYYRQAVGICDDEEKEYYLILIASFYMSHNMVREGKEAFEEATRLEGSCSRAKFLFGLYLMRDGSEVERGLSLIIESASEGFGAAEFELGELYREGKYLERDIDESNKFYEISAIKGIYRSCHEVGKIFESEGEISYAITMYEKACFVHNEDAERRLLDLSQEIVDRSDCCYGYDHSFGCMTCWCLVDICPFCISTCHKGHDIIDYGIDVDNLFDCDCGIKGVKCRAKE